MKTLTKLEIIQETVDYYSVDPVARRSKNDQNKCVYLSDTGQVCAFSRVMLKKQRDLIVKEGYQEATARKISEHKGLDRLLKIRYRGHDINFWADIQYLHDHNKFWCSDGLTDYGKERVRILMKLYQ